MADSSDDVYIGEKYLDKNNKELESGFYIHSDKPENLLYFTGRYGKFSEYPIFEKENEIGKEEEFSTRAVRRLYKIAKQEARDKIKELKKRKSWIEKRLFE